MAERKSLIGEFKDFVLQGNVIDLELRESDATKALAAHLKANPQLTPADAKAYLKGYQISARGFQSRIWPAARTRAGLVPKASPGRKPKSSRPQNPSSVGATTTAIQTAMSAHR